MKIFLSSVVRGMEPFRDAAARAIRALGHDVLRSEDFGASPDAPRRACLAEVRTADAVVLLLGSRYGQPQDNGLSATHEEYREARERLPVFVFVQAGVDVEPPQRKLLEEAQNWGSGHLTERFESDEDLRDGVTRAIHRWQLEQAADVVDVDEMRQLAERWIPDARSQHEARVCVVAVGGPPQTVLRPGELEDPAFRRRVQQDAAFGRHAVLDPDGATSGGIQDDALVLEQDHASLLVGPDGSVRILLAAKSPADRRGMALSVLIEEDLRDRIATSLAFTADLLDRIDSEHQLAEILPVVACLDAGYLGWQTRAEHAASDGSVMIGSRRPDVVRVELKPPVIKRGTLHPRIDQLAEDFTVLLRRRMRP